MVVKNLKETSYDGMIIITTDDNFSFYLRKEYLVNVDFNDITIGAFFEDSDEEEILDAALTASAECKAITYLARAEQSHFGLKQKLIKKGHDKKYIDQALDYLESKNYLNDSRYALAWLHTRKINHYEGKSKLKAELSARGIGRDDISKALDIFFTEEDETKICEKAYLKAIKNGKTDEKLLKTLITWGFSMKMIREAKENLAYEKKI